MIRIEPLGTRHLLPAILVGYELGGDDHDTVDGFADSPPWLLTIDQQAGGMAMSYPSTIGAVLRLSSNVARGLIDPAPMIRGFQLMAEDPKVGVLRRDYPILSRLVCTQGENYSRDDINRLNDYLRQYFQLPQLTDGIEAFVRAEPCDPLEYFAEWAVMTAVVRMDCPTRTVYAGQRAFCVEEGNVNDLILTDDIQFCEIAEQLASFASRLPSRPTLRAFLLWENSD